MNICRVIVEGICRIFERAIVAEINIIVNILPLFIKFILKSGNMNYYVKNRNILETYLQTLFLRIDNFIQNFRRNSKRVREIAIKLFNCLSECWEYLFPDELSNDIIDIHVCYVSEMYCRLLTPDGVSKSPFKEDDKRVYFENQVFFKVDIEISKINCLMELMDQKEFSKFLKVRHELLNASVQSLFVSYLIYEHNYLIQKNFQLLQKLIIKRYELIRKQQIYLTDYETETIIECVKFLTRNVRNSNENHNLNNETIKLMVIYI